MPARCIVVVDDDSPFLDLMRDVLTDEGYEVVAGSVAGDAVRLVAAHRPALVILDLVMATQEAGLDTLRELRADPTTAALPVLIATANRAFVRERAGEARALDAEVIGKPFDLAELLEIVGRLAGPPE